MASLTSTVIEYMLTAGEHDAALPDMEKNQCFKKSSTGAIFYDFGPESFQENLVNPTSSSDTPKKITSSGTFKRGRKEVSENRKRLFQK